MTEDEVKDMLKRKAEKKKAVFSKTYEEMKAATEKEDSATSPLLVDADLNILTQAKTKLTQGDILKMYVKNSSELDLKQRRKVIGVIQAQRSKHAKEVFLKELSSIGRKIQKQDFAVDTENTRIKNRKDPLKLKLENITAWNIRQFKVLK